jgi:alkanesulfonate monooxygenase SsuD/methylene tetrahydromethanopterin reductase-like flavin-dependent oxidoreductase (luciferase family)
MKIGVLFPSQFEEPGEFYADARAMEAAGVDSVWMEDDGVGLDPLLALAAIGASAHQLRLGFIRSSSSVGNPEYERRILTLQRLTRQRTVVGVAESASIIGGQERWRRVEVPADREAWAQIVERSEPETDGVLVPMDPRLLDILRHPEEAIDRPDLQLAQG